ncbi:MAG: hypothetical protein IPL55_07375 [Saprospiraceae bacterium]|nr:hypothetical protein [Saprospiraceae bacterium]
MANIAIDFQNGNRPEDSDRVVLNFNFDDHELKIQYLVKCFYKRSRRIEPEGWIQFSELKVNADKTTISKEVQFNFVRDTQFQQDIAFKCDLHLLISEYESQNFILR